MRNNKPIRIDVSMIVPDMSFSMPVPISALKTGPPVRRNDSPRSSSPAQLRAASLIFPIQAACSL